ncbi:MAG: hypothetical protein ACLQVM_12135 [Terriglobia bacterium]
MGIMENKVTRRVAIATGALGLATAPLIIRSLRGKYETNIPTAAQSFAPARVKSSGTVTVNGHSLQVPPVEMEVEKPGDWEKFRSLSQEATKKALDNDSGYQADLKQRLAANRGKLEKQANDRSQANAPSPLKQMEADIQRYNAQIDNNNTIDAANKELLKKAFRESMQKSYETIGAQIKKS